MADPANIVAHLKAGAEWQRQLDRVRQLRNEAAAFSMLQVATTLQGGAALNTLKGTLPFALRNAARGLATVATANRLGGATIYTPVPPPPPRRRRGRR
jgi:hypothetical protein